MYATDILTKTYKAEHDITRYAVVGAGNADFTCDMPAAAGELPLGVALEDADADHDVAVRQIGIAECVASALIARFARVSIADTDGKIRTAVAGDHVVGIALKSAAADGDIIPVLLALGSGYDEVDDASVTAAKLADDAVETDKILDEAVTVDKMADVARGSILVGAADNRPAALDAKGDGKILVGDATDLKSVSVSGDATLANTGALTIANEAVTLAKTADLARGSIVVGGADNRPTALDAKTDAQILVADGTDLKSVAMSGDVAIDNTGATTIQADAVETAMIADAQVTAAKLAASLAALIQGTCTFVIGAEGGDAIVVTVQLKDANGVNIAAKHSVNVWLSDAAGGAECAVAPDGAVAISTKGVIIKSFTAKLNHQIVTAADGAFDLSITESAAKTLYVNVEYQGKVISSDAVTFAGP